MKRIVKFAAVALFLCLLLPVVAAYASGSPEAAAGPIYGDVNGDGVVDVDDILAVRNVIFDVTSPSYDEALDFTVSACAVPFKENAPGLSLARSRQDLQDILSANYHYSYTTELTPDEKYDDTYFEENFVIVLAGALAQNTYDQVWLKGNQLMVYTTQGNYFPPIALKYVVLIEVGNSKLDNVQSLALYHKAYPSQPGDAYVKIYEGNCGEAA